MENKSIISPLKHFQESIEKVAAKVRRHTLPLYYFEKGNDTPQQCATGVIIDISGNKYLLTASHVFDSDIEINLMFKDWIQPLNGVGCIMESKRDKDSSLIDTTICLLDKSVVDRIEQSPKYDFYKLDKVCYFNTSDYVKSYIILGYPYRHTKLDYVNKKITPKLFSIGTEPADDKYYEKHGFKKTHNIILNYRSRRQSNFRDSIVQGPKLDGFSGCGIWYIPTMVDFKNEIPDYYFKGILTEWIKKDSIVVGQNIKFIIDSFQLKFNEKII